MKKIAILALACILALAFSGCGYSGNEDYPWSLTKSSMDIKNDTDAISIRFSDGSLTSTGAQLTVCNNSDSEIDFGSEYSIQLYKDNSWYDIDAGAVDWTGELFTVSAGDQYEAEIDWTAIYGELPVGKYRIVKKYSQLEQTCFAVAEFEIS